MSPIEQCAEALRAYLRGERVWTYDEIDPSPRVLCLALTALLPVSILALLVFSMTDIGRPAPLVPLAVFTTPWVVAITAVARNAYRSRQMALSMGVRGIDRLGLSAVLQFLDMLTNCVPQVGRIEGHQPPETRTGTGFDTIALYVRRLLPELGEQWYSAIISSMSGIEGRRSVVAGAALLVIAAVAGAVARLFPLIITTYPLPSEVYMWVVVGLFLVMVIGTLLLVYGLRRQKALETLQDVETRLASPTLEEMNRSTIQAVINLVRDEALCPVRAFLLAEYPGTVRTQKTLVTSRGYMLHETLVIPRSMEDVAEVAFGALGEQLDPFRQPT